MQLRLVPDAEVHAGFPVRLAQWLRDRSDLVRVIVALRRFRNADDALAALLALPDVHEIRTTWENWLAEVDDPERAASLLLAAVPADALTNSIRALWRTPVNTTIDHVDPEKNFDRQLRRGNPTDVI